jgi:hypothetical protein
MEKVVGRLVGAALVLFTMAGCGGDRSSPPKPAVAPALAPPDPSNQLPFGALDAPAANAAVPRKVTVSGWAMDDTGVEGVRVYVDGHFIQSTTLTVDRADVSAVVPAYARQSDRHGWTVTIGLEPGTHTILAQAVDRAGATRDLGSAPVTVRP